jgi:hypothetical protein
LFPVLFAIAALKRQRGLKTLAIKECPVPIRPYLKEGAFAPDVVSAMATAFDDACKALAASSGSTVTKETLATKILELARGGETDPIVLREMVLSEFGLSPVSKTEE